MRTWFVNTFSLNGDKMGIEQGKPLCAREASAEPAIRTQKSDDFNKNT
jgi:hypothetical protein